MVPRVHPVKAAPVSDAEWADHGMIEHRPRRPEYAFAFRETPIELVEMSTDLRRNFRETATLRHHQCRRRSAGREVADRDAQHSDGRLARRPLPHRYVPFTQAPFEARSIPRVGQIQVLNDVGDRPDTVGRNLGIGS